MLRRSRLAATGLLLTGSPLFAQFPAPPAQPVAAPLPAGRSPYQPLSPPINITRLPEPPKVPSQGNSAPGFVRPASGATPLPPSAIPTQPGFADGSTPPPFTPVETPLPYPEAKYPFDAGAVTLKRAAGSWQVWAGPRVLKDLGDDETGAKDVVRVLRELRPTEWAGIGTPRPVVEYGLVNGRPPVTAGFPRAVVPIDLRTVRVEPLKGVWCLRDDGSILFNFGLRKADADQALAVVRRYGFNRVGAVGGNVAAPALTYFYVALEADGARPAGANPLLVAAQEHRLARTGIPVPGIGYVGEMVRIDPRKADVRRDGSEWVVAAGAEVLARFGPDNWAARDALRVVQDGRFTEFCRVGAGGLTFFLVDGKAPTRVPLAVQGRRFDPDALKVHAVGPKWAVTEAGRHLFDVGDAAEGEAVVRLLRHYHFDQLCHVGPSPRTGLVFLARGGR